MAEGVLGNIVAAKREELASRFAGASLESLRARARPTGLSLASAIARPGGRFILEIKKASPSQGSIRPGADVAALARGYAPVADALSVLSDSPFFGGSLDDVRTARRNFAGPILAKDFFIDLRQVAEARIAGADAILVMLSVLDDGEAQAMIAEARRFGMDSLVEVHDEAEMRRALGLGAQLIGINNRDLRDLSINLSTTERLASLAAGRLLVSESGIGSRRDIDRLSGSVDGFLVGSALMTAPDPAQAARELIFGRVKLCGVRRSEDVAAGAPAAFAGFVFVPESPRCLSPASAVPLAVQAREHGSLPVGVFRNAPICEAADAARMLGLHAVQLHGAESADDIAALRRQLPGDCEIWTAVDSSRDCASRPGGDRMLFDNGAGGTGRCFDWRKVAQLDSLANAILAGGIGPSNAAEARALGAYAIDVGSSLDLAPGVKSADKIAGLFDCLRPTARGLSSCA